MQALAEWLANSWWMLVAAGLGALGLWLVHRGLLADRAMGRRRCPKCWYELQAAPSPVQCTECGRVATSERELLRTHRRWGVVIAGVVLLAVSPWMRRIPDAVDHGWARLVPTWALLQLCGDEQVKQWTEETLLWGPKASSPFAKELVRRGVEEAIPMWQSEMFERRVRRYLVSKGEAVMPSGEEEVLRRLDAARLPSDRSIPEMEELFAEIGKALGTRVEVDWESMWEGRILRTDKVGVDTRGLTCGEVLDRIVRSKSVGEPELGWHQGDGVLRCVWRTGRARGLWSYDMGKHIRLAQSYADPFLRYCTGPAEAKSDEQLRRGACIEVEMQISSAVDPELWRWNGGIDARLVMCGNRMLVTAPIRTALRMRSLLERLDHPVRAGDDPLGKRTAAATVLYRGEQRARTLAYEVADFVEWQRGFEARESLSARIAPDIADELGKILISSIQPDSWMQNGGEIGSVQVLGHFLIVTHIDGVHTEIARLLDAVRARRPTLLRGG